MKKVCIAIVCLVLSLIAPTIYVVKSIQFDQQCGGFLKQASDANSVELAEKQLSIAVNYIEEKGLTSGYTSVIFNVNSTNFNYL